MITSHALLSSTWRSEHIQWYISWPGIPCNLLLLLDVGHSAHCRAPRDLPLYPCLELFKDYFFASVFFLSCSCFVHDLKPSSFQSCWKSNFDSLLFIFFCYPPQKIGQHCKMQFYLIFDSQKSLLWFSPNFEPHFSHFKQSWFTGEIYASSSNADSSHLAVATSLTGQIQNSLIGQPRA